MNRRQCVVGIAALSSSAVAGCFSRESGGAQQLNLTPTDDRDVEAVSSTTFDEDVTPICAEGESLTATVDGPNADAVVAHEFVRDPKSGRYGVRGRIEPGEWGNIPSIRAAFDDGSSESTRVYGLDADETSLFTITTADGAADEIGEYTLTVRDGETADIGRVSEQYATVDGDWGRIGTYDGSPVYGYSATVANDHSEAVELYPRLKAYLDETTVAYSGTATESAIDVAPGETRAVFFPYPRCDPGSIVTVEAWLDWPTMLYP
ncbi:hypothetical protein [Natrialba sp. PRR66]|uniref:hypothetical protein n=1 Tax=Natrialba sp. PRR66 TaxID=3098146 RepID=UPI002B1DB3CE|nr:hypothetical protein [Natrialba sp. PRR66]